MYFSDDTRWETVTRTSNGMLEGFTISYQSLLPSTAYSFRVIAYNMYGISNPAYSDKVIVTPSKLYLEYGYLQYRPFYRRTWFMVALAAASIIIIIMVIAILCVKSKSYKYKSEYFSDMLNYVGESNINSKLCPCFKKRPIIICVCVLGTFCSLVI